MPDDIRSEDAMPIHCVVAGCHTEGGMGYSLHGFPSDAAVRSKWVMAVHQQHKDWKGLTTASLICLKLLNLNALTQRGDFIVKKWAFQPRSCASSQTPFQLFSPSLFAVVAAAATKCQHNLVDQLQNEESKKQCVGKNNISNNLICIKTLLIQIVEELLDTSSTMQSSADDPRSSSPVEDIGSPLLLASTSTGMIPMEIQSGADDKG